MKILTLTFVVLSVFLAVTPCFATLEKRPPNIIVIMADDLGCGDLSLYDGWIQTPRIDRMAREGMYVITEKGIDFIKRNKEKPFFLYLPHAAVHNPYQAPADTPETRDKDWKKHAINDVNRPRYKAILEELDKGVGQVLETLVELGIGKNTIVVFLSDNGAVPMNPNERPFRGGKFSNHEGGHRVPAVVWWPGMIKAGAVSNDLVIGFDFLPTLTEIAGLSEDNPGNLDGISIKAHMLEQEALPARDIFFGYEPKLGTAMRRGDWKMIVKGDDVQLFNLENDLKETTNVSAVNLKVTASMRKAIEGFKETVVPGS